LHHHGNAVRVEREGARMKIPRPTEGARVLFERLVPEDDRVEVKPMFGNLGAFVNGNMFMGLFGADLGVKLTDADQQALLAAGGRPFGPSERPMSGYVSLPETLDAESARPWVRRSLDYVGGMPPKAPKPRKKAARAV
jgi:TfoX/Sxy family transcriptional regulator of competence genes